MKEAAQVVHFLEGLRKPPRDHENDTFSPVLAPILIRFRVDVGRMWGRLGEKEKRKIRVAIPPQGRAREAGWGRPTHLQEEK